MRRSPLALLGFILSGSWSFAFAQDTAAKTEEITIEKIPALMEASEERLQKSIKAMQTVVDAEAAAERLSKPAAESLRWTLRCASGTFAPDEIRLLIASSQVQASSPAAAKALAEFDASWTATQTEREAWQKVLLEETPKRAANLVRTGASKTEIVKLLEASAAARSAFERRKSYRTSQWDSLLAAGTLLETYRRFAEAEEAGEPSQIAEAGQQLLRLTKTNPTVPEAEVRNRITKALEPFISALERAQASIASAIEARRPAEELSPLLAKLNEADERLKPVQYYSRDLPVRDTRTLPPAYRAVAAAILSPESNASEARLALHNAAESLKTAGGENAAKTQMLLAKLEADFNQIIAATVQEQTEKWRASLAAAKSANDLNQLALELAGPFGGREGSVRSSYSSVRSTLARQISALAAAWSAGNSALLQQTDSSFADEPPSPFAGDFVPLRQRIEREILAKNLRLDELTRPPLSEQDLETAMESVSRDLAKRREWRRLLTVLETRLYTRARSSESPETDAAKAVRAFLAAQNFETAEQWTDAVSSYKTVLQSVDERAPIEASAERLRALQKKHPEAFKGTSESSALSAPPKSR